jgi:hypothetical protein
MNDKELDDIKRTLQRIQRIASEPIDETDAGDEAGTDAGDGPNDSVAAAKLDAAEKPPGPSSAKHRVDSMLPRQHATVVALAALALLATAGVTSRLLLGPDVEPEPTPLITNALRIEPEQRVTISAPHDALRVNAEAQALLETGRVIEARRGLMGLPVKSPEAALILARSYDPNYLRLIPNADAVADPTEAERWYRIWRAIASEQGLVLELDRFDRIIKAMR